MSEKPDCYKCQYRGGVPGSCHSSCNHPAFTGMLNNSVLGLMAMLASVGRVKPIIGKDDEIIVKGHSTGIKRGWFNHPFNFDPAWLQSCNGFKDESEPEGVERGNNPPPLLRNSAIMSKKEG